MPGAFLHMDIARKAVASLDSNPGASAIFGTGGPPPADLTRIGQENPAYLALGAIGPDIFFLLPDFKPGFGTMMWGAANTIRDLYTWWDDNFLDPYERTLGAVGANLSAGIDALSGGVLGQLSAVFSRAAQYLMATAQLSIVRSYDVFGLLGSGIPTGYDEQTFFWSDMLHYRKTFEFARELWVRAEASGNEAFQAYAIGWMSHLATDTAGHGFVNEKCGGPYRLHWQRHKCVENHMDGLLYENQFGSDPIYQMLSCSALHLWIAFNPYGSSRVDFFQHQPSGNYDPADDTTAAHLGRQAIWGFDSEMPADLATFLADTIQAVYTDTFTGVALPTGQEASHPTIIEEYVPGSGGYASAANIQTCYWWLYNYLNLTTTDFFKIRRPTPPNVINVPQFPSPPGTGAPAPGPGATSSPWQTVLEVLLAILAWIAYLGQVIAWAITVLPAIVASLGTYPVRYVLYQYLEVPIYNAWLAMHWYFAMTGFAFPMPTEVTPGLHTLGVSVTNVWETFQAALNSPSGGLIAAPTMGDEPSGNDRGEGLPKNLVADDPAFLQTIAPFAGGFSPTTDIPSEFLRPWLWPAVDNEGDAVPFEFRLATESSPHPAMTDPTVLMGGMPGDASVRRDFEASRSEQETLDACARHLPAGRSLGDPIDFTTYVIARLTRLSPASIANFNLDADRGYGYLCWDWVRSTEARAIPAAYQGRTPPEHEYRAPLRPGAGWNAGDVVTPATTPGQEAREADHAAGEPVRIRYLDREDRA